MSLQIPGPLGYWVRTDDCLDIGALSTGPLLLQFLQLHTLQLADFDPGVLAQVLGVCRTKRKAAKAILASVRLLAGVQATMLIPVHLLCETLAAKVALVGLLARVNANVLLQVVLVKEGFATTLTHMLLDPFVGALHMQVESALLHVAVPTHVARESLIRM